MGFGERPALYAPLRRRAIAYGFACVLTSPTLPIKGRVFLSCRLPTHKASTSPLRAQKGEGGFGVSRSICDCPVLKGEGGDGPGQAVVNSGFAAMPFCSRTWLRKRVKR